MRRRLRGGGVRGRREQGWGGGGEAGTILFPTVIIETSRVHAVHADEGGGGGGVDGREKKEKEDEEEKQPEEEVPVASVEEGREEKENENVEAPEDIPGGPTSRDTQPIER